jgi:hypothetical protein
MSRPYSGSRALPVCRSNLATSCIRIAYKTLGMPDDVEIFRGMTRTAYVTSFSVIVASIIQWRSSSGLSLVDGLIVTMLSTTATLVGNGMDDYVWSLRHEEGGHSLNLAYLLHSTAWTVFGLLVWSQVSTFGNVASGGCSADANVKFVVFGRAVPATNQGLRIFSLCVFTIGWLSTMGGIVGEFFSGDRPWMRKLKQGKCKHFAVPPSSCPH